MKTHPFFLLAIGLLGCSEPQTNPSDSGTPCPVNDASVMPDQAPVRCTAAEGLPGDVLGGLCLDMDKIDTQGLIDRGFLLGAGTGCSGWGVINNKLQAKDVNANGRHVQCDFAFPGLNIDAKYSRILVAVTHQTSLYVLNQAAMIAHSAATPKAIWVWGAGGSLADQRTIIEFPKNQIPSSDDFLQLIVKFYSPPTMYNPSWAIDSIAVLGKP